jgi:hypothetical protein
MRTMMGGAVAGMDKIKKTSRDDPTIPTKEAKK